MTDEMLAPETLPTLDMPFPVAGEPKPDPLQRSMAACLGAVALAEMALSGRGWTPVALLLAGSLLACAGLLWTGRKWAALLGTACASAVLLVDGGRLLALLGGGSGMRAYGASVAITLAAGTVLAGGVAGRRACRESGEGWQRVAMASCVGACLAVCGVVILATR